MNAEEPLRKRRFLQFSLRQLLSLLAVLGIFLAILAPRFHRAFRERQFQENFRRSQETRKNLVLAVRNNDLSLARRALDTGIDPDQVYGGGSPPLLHIAIGNGYLAMTELLLDYGADVERLSPALFPTSPSAGGPPLYAAINCRQSTEVRLQMIRLLIQRGANPRAEVRGCTAMDFVVYGDGDGEVGDLLREHGLPYGPREMAAFNRLDELKRAVGEQPDLVKKRFQTPFFVPPGQGSTLLGIALGKGYREMGKFLIEAGAPLDELEGPGMTPLHTAARGGDPDLIRLLVARGLDVNARQQGYATPLVLAVMAGKSDAVAALLDTGANAKDAPLYHAVLKNQVEIVQVLVAAGVDPTNPISQDWMSSGVTFSGGIAVRKVNPTPLDMARKKMSEYAKWPANLPLPDNGDGPMPLDVARKKNSEIVKLLEQAARSKPPQNPSAP